MPAFPKSVQQVMTLASDIACPQKELVEAIKNDPSAQVRQAAVVAASDPLARTTARVLCKTMMEDDEARLVHTITLSYTFYETEMPQTDAADASDIDETDPAG